MSDETPRIKLTFNPPEDAPDATPEQRAYLAALEAALNEGDRAQDLIERANKARDELLTAGSTIIFVPDNSQKT